MRNCAFYPQLYILYVSSLLGEHFFVSLQTHLTKKILVPRVPSPTQNFDFLTRALLWVSIVQLHTWWGHSCHWYTDPLGRSTGPVTYPATIKSYPTIYFVQCGVVQYGEVQCGVVQCGEVQCGEVQCSVVHRGVVQCGVV